MAAAGGVANSGSEVTLDFYEDGKRFFKRPAVGTFYFNNIFLAQCKSKGYTPEFEMDFGDASDEENLYGWEVSKLIITFPNDIVKLSVNENIPTIEIMYNLNNTDETNITYINFKEDKIPSIAEIIANSYAAIPQEGGRRRRRRRTNRKRSNKRRASRRSATRRNRSNRR